MIRRKLFWIAQFDTSLVMDGIEDFFYLYFRRQLGGTCCCSIGGHRGT